MISRITQVAISILPLVFSSSCVIDDRESPIPFILAIGAPRAGFFGLLSSRCTERAESFELRGAPCDVTKSKWNCGLSGELLNPKPSLMGRSGKRRGRPLHCCLAGHWLGLSCPAERAGEGLKQSLGLRFFWFGVVEN